MAKAEKKRASRLEYQSQYQLVIPGFEMPFEKHLNPENRWVVLAKTIPWDRMVNIYVRKMGKSNFGTSKINPRMVLGALIIKHYMGYTDRETVEMIRENVYMQYFVGLSSFSHEAIFDASLFVTIRKRLEESAANEINELVIKYWKEQEEKKEEKRKEASKTKTDQGEGKEEDSEGKIKKEEVTQNVQKGEIKEKEEEKEEAKEEQNDHQGTLIIDATACPQAIAYPTDIKLLNECREHLEGIIDSFHAYMAGKKGEEKVKKPRTYREEARAQFLKIAQDKNPGVKKIRKGVRKQLNYIKRNFRHIDKYLQEVKMGEVLRL